MVAWWALEYLRFLVLQFFPRVVVISGKLVRIALPFQQRKKEAQASDAQKTEAPRGIRNCIASPT